MTWTCGSREIQIDEERSQFTSNTPWESTELNALRSIRSVRSVDQFTEHRIGVYPQCSSVKEMMTPSVKAVVKIHVENVCRVLSKLNEDSRRK